MIGSTAIRFGDRFIFGHLLPSPGSSTGIGPASLFSLNMLHSIFGGPINIQGFDGSRWNPVWSDNGQVSPQCQGGCTGNIGCWTLGNPRDNFYFTSLEGLGGPVDELICANEAHWQAYNYNSTSQQWCPDETAGHRAWDNNGVLGSYTLGVGDRFVFGHFDSGFIGNLVLCLNPMPQPLWCGTRKDPVLLEWDTNFGASWLTRWASQHNSRYLGNWRLYQDLP
jgi:hypothetical protein